VAERTDEDELDGVTLALKLEAAEGCVVLRATREVPQVIEHLLHAPYRSLLVLATVPKACSMGNLLFKLGKVCPVPLWALQVRPTGNHSVPRLPRHVMISLQVRCRDLASETWSMGNSHDSRAAAPRLLLRQLQAYFLRGAYRHTNICLRSC
jgi:hypothetical protein